MLLDSTTMEMLSHRDQTTWKSISHEGKVRISMCLTNSEKLVWFHHWNLEGVKEEDDDDGSIPSTSLVGRMRLAQGVGFNGIYLRHHSPRPSRPPAAILSWSTGDAEGGGGCIRPMVSGSTSSSRPTPASLRPILPHCLHDSGMKNVTSTLYLVQSLY